MNDKLSLEEFVERLNIENKRLEVNVEKTEAGTYLLTLTEKWGPIVEHENLEVAKLLFEKYFKISNVVTQAIVLNYYYRNALNEKEDKMKARHLAEETFVKLHKREKLEFV